jgi:hypothetical protein
MPKHIPIWVSPLQSSPEAVSLPATRSATRNRPTATPQQQPVKLEPLDTVQTAPLKSISSQPAHQVTPPEQDDVNIGKQVRFTSEQDAAPKNEDTAAVAAAKGCVSKRGGRYVSPGRRNGSNNSSQSPSVQTPSLSSLVEYKTYRSPDNSVVPSLCSAPSHDDTKQPAAKSDDLMVRLYDSTS